MTATETDREPGDDRTQDDETTDWRVEIGRVFRIHGEKDPFKAIDTAIRTDKNSKPSELIVRIKPLTDEDDDI